EEKKGTNQRGQWKRQGNQQRNGGEMAKREATKAQVRQRTECRAAPVVFDGSPRIGRVEGFACPIRRPCLSRPSRLGSLRLCRSDGVCRSLFDGHPRVYLRCGRDDYLSWG